MAKKSKAKPKAKAAHAPKPKAKKAAKPAARKPAPKKAAAKVKPAAKVKSAPKAKPTAKAKISNNNHAPATKAVKAGKEKPAKPAKLSPFQKKQLERLLGLRDSMLDSMAGVAKDNLRARAEGSEASAFGMHQADAGSDAYDRDFALNLLSQEQDALYEIEEAIKRLEGGSYGVCELCSKKIPDARLEAIPFARFTVDCQSKLEKERKLTRSRQPVTSLFGLTDDEDGDGEEAEEKSETPAENNKE